MDAKAEITDLTICRAFFAAWVFAYHVNLYLGFAAWLGPFRGLIRHGYLGVDGFFILSGLILMHVHSGTVRSRPGVLNFWGRRLARLYPVHLATLILLALILLGGLAAGMAPREPQHFGLGAFLQNIFLVHGWGFSSQGAWNYPSWSVSTEWAGYLLFPLFCFVVLFFDWYVAVQFIIVGFLLLGLIIARFHSLNLAFAWGLIRFFPEFIIGISTVRFVPLVADAAAFRYVSLVMGGAFVLLGACAGSDLTAVLGLWLVLFACVMQADAKRPPFIRAPLLRRFGLLSYSFYMSFAVAELLVVQWFRRHGLAPASHAWAFAAGMLGITLILSIALHVTVEIPCRRRADHMLERTASP